MEELKQILIRKAKIIGQLKYPKKNNRQSTLKYLKKLKREERENQIKEKTVISTLFQEKYDLKQHVEKVYFLSFHVMKGFSKKFEFMPEQKEIYVNIVQMHFNFYLKHDFADKAEQIKAIYKKKICQKQVFLPTLLTWLYEWGRKKLQKFIQRNIQQIQKQLLMDKLESPSKRYPSNTQQNSLVNNSILVSNQNELSHLFLDGTFKRISCSEKIPTKNQLEMKIHINGVKNIFMKQLTVENENDIGPFVVNANYEFNENLNEDELVLNQQIGVQNRIETYFEPQKNDEYSLLIKNQCIKNRSKSYNVPYANGRQKTVMSSININKEIFYGTYWREMHQLYRNLNCVQDLDGYYLKTFKKQKQENKIEIYENKMEELLENIIKNMPKVRKTIQAYEKQYMKNCPEEIKKKNSKIGLQQGGSDNKKNDNLLTPHNIFQSKYWNLRNLRKKSPTSIFQNQLVSPEKANFKQDDQAAQQQENIFRKEQQASRQQMIINKIFERNRSYNDTLQKKFNQQKNNKEIKLPTVYNPQNLYHLRDTQAEKAMMIHQKFQKFIISGNSRPNKGLMRYKLLNKDRCDRISVDFNNNIPFLNNGNQIMSDRVFENISASVQLEPQHEYEVANIRKILRKREKQRMYRNKTPIIETQTEASEKETQKAILQIKVVEAQRKMLQEQKNQNFNLSKSIRKGQKFQVFLSNLRNNSTASPSPFKNPNQRPNNLSFNFGPLKSAELMFQDSIMKQQRITDVLPRIS